MVVTWSGWVFWGKVSLAFEEPSEAEAVPEIPCLLSAAPISTFD